MIQSFFVVYHSVPLVYIVYIIYTVISFVSEIMYWSMKQNKGYIILYISISIHYYYNPYPKSSSGNQGGLSRGKYDIYQPRKKTLYKRST